MPETFIEVAVSPETPEDVAKLVVAMRTILAEDSTCTATYSAENKELILKGQSEFQLQELVTKLRGIFSFNLGVGAPQVIYKRTFHRHATIDYTFEDSRSGKLEFAKVVLRFDPLPYGTGYLFESKISENALPLVYAQSIAATLQAINKSGYMEGFPVTDFKATIKMGCACVKDSSVSAFEFATSIALNQAINQATILLEPIMKIDVITRENFMGTVIGDLNKRRGQISGMHQRCGAHIIKAMVPMAEMFGYVNNLHLMTQGNATHSMRFDHYEPVLTAQPPDDGCFPPAAAIHA